VMPSAIVMTQPEGPWTVSQTSIICKFPSLRYFVIATENKVPLFCLSH
jgi:hypothetical protein